MAARRSQAVVSLYGDWWKARRITTNLPYKLVNAAGAGLQQEAEAAARRLQYNIRAQNYPHVALAPSTVEQKEREGLDSRTLIAEGDYVDSISAVEVSKTVWGVGTNDPEQAAKGRAHEFGYKNIPARPHFRVELERIRSGRLPSIASAMAAVLRGG